MDRLNKLKEVIELEIKKDEPLFWENVSEGKYPMINKFDTDIVNPFVDEADMRNVDPIEYYSFTNEELEVYYKGWDIK